MIRCDVAVIGGGFSGSMVTAQLARHGRIGPFGVHVRRPRSRPRRRIRHAHREHLLNTRARAMSAFPDDPDHFVRWLGPRAAPDDFVSRRLYGDYVAEIARQRSSASALRWSTIASSPCRRGEHGRFVLTTSVRSAVRGASRRLATGNVAPNDDFLRPRSSGIRDTSASRGVSTTAWLADTC